MSQSNIAGAATLVVSLLSLAATGLIYWELSQQRPSLSKSASQSEELSAVRAVDAHQPSGSEPPSAYKADDAKAIEDLRNEIRSLRSLLASAQSVAPSLPGTSAGPARGMPLLLRQFLEEAKDPKVLMVLKPGERETTRRELVSVINSLPGSQRDELREEIALANWILEIVDLVASGPSGTVDERLTDFVTLKGLLDADPSQAPTQLKVEADRQFKEVTAALANDLKGVTDSLHRAGLTIPEAEVNRGLLIADLLQDEGVDQASEQGRACELFLAIHRWLERGKKQLEAEVKDAGKDLVARQLAMLAQEGEGLRDQTHSMAFGIPDALVVQLDALSKLANDHFEGQQKRLRAAYQEWALVQIQVAGNLAAGKASEVIDDGLKHCKQDPSAAATSPLYKSIIGEYPTFRFKLAELTGIEALRTEDAPVIDASLLYNVATALDQKLGGWRGHKELAECLVRDVMVVRLLPVDEGLLERPVANLYSDVFESCWKYLEGTPHRIEVAKAAATSEKIQLGDLVPKGNAQGK